MSRTPTQIIRDLIATDPEAIKAAAEPFKAMGFGAVGGYVIDRLNVVGRIEGFFLDLRTTIAPAAAGGSRKLDLGRDLFAHPTMLVRVTARRRGGMEWSRACQHWPPREAAAKLRVVSSDDVRMTLDLIRRTEEEAESLRRTRDAANGDRFADAAWNRS